MIWAMGRPSSFTQEIADEICSQLASGESIRAICDDEEGLPSATTVFRWLAKYPEFREQYMCAREARADARFERIDGVVEDMRTGAIDHNQARVEIDAIKWQAGKESPKRYGDRLELAGDKDAPLTITVRRLDKA